MQSKSKANVPKGNVGNHHLPDVRKVIPVPLTQPEYLEALRNLKSAPGGEVALPLRYKVDFPGKAGLPYRVVYNGNSLMSICSDADKVVVAKPPILPEGRYTYFQAGESEAQSMAFMVYAANQYEPLCTDLLTALRSLSEAREEIEGRKDQISDLHELRESAESERDQLQQEKEKYRLDAEWQYTECNRLRQQIADAVKELGFALESSGEIAIVAYIGGLLACIQKSRSILAPPAQGKGRERNDSRYEATTKRRRTFR